MDENFEMDEKIKEALVRLVAGLSPESYERLGPGLRELGVALAEQREALEELERANERTQNALRLIKDAE